MAGRAVITFNLLEVLDVDHGHWCRLCALPSAARITIASQVGQGPVKLSTGYRCETHGWLRRGDGEESSGGCH